MRSRLPLSLSCLKVLPLIGVLGLGACGLTQAQVPPRQIPVQQSWTLQPGSEVGGFKVMGGLGDISIDVQGGKIKAPFDGQLQPTDSETCVAFTSPEVPAYLFRLCGVTKPRLGDVAAGQVMGRSQVLQFAAMRRQPDGQWAIVEPATDILEKTLGKSASSK
ncbi:MAG: hypothetical protein F6K00_31200 [Leptolyngbya sp. SIOISBB]|nr:hypothetical protein [Leptolyngbya sp. SIOISBB]